jgi:hypothetical protein
MEMVVWMEEVFKFLGDDGTQFSLDAQAMRLWVQCNPQPVVNAPVEETYFNRIILGKAVDMARVKNLRCWSRISSRTTPARSPPRPSRAFLPITPANDAPARSMPGTGRHPGPLFRRACPTTGTANCRSIYVCSGILA